MILVCSITQIAGEILPCHTLQSEVPLKRIQHPLNRVAVSVMRPHDKVGLKGDSRRDGKLRRALTDGDMKDTQRLELSGREVLGLMNQCRTVHKGVCGRDALGDRLDKIKLNKDDILLCPDIHGNLMLLVHELLGECGRLCLRVVGHGNRCRHIHMHLDRVSRIRNSSALPIARSDCLSGDMRERIHIDNIAGHLVIIYADGDRPALLPARECIRADVVDCSFYGDNEVVVDVLQHILRVQFVQIHQFPDTRKNIRCTDPLAVNHQILFGVSIVICHQKLHDRSSSSFLYSYHSFKQI